MTFLQIVNIIRDTALAQPNVNTVVREFLDLNREDTKYSAVVIQDRDGLRDRIVEQDWNTYTFHLGYVDRLTFDEKNRDDIFSTGINVINNIVASIRERWDLEVSIIDRFSTFNQRFTASCAGVYVVLAIQVPVSDCVDTEETNIYEKFSIDITNNGHYHYVPDGRPYGDIDITVNVSGGGEKPEERLIRTITSNSNYQFYPTPGSVFSEAEITVSVPSETKPESRLIETITSNSNYQFYPTPGSVFSGADIVVSVHPSKSFDITYIDNGVYTVMGEFNGGTVRVSVPSEQKPEGYLEETITSNGSYHYNPSPGTVFNSADITVDVHPSNSLSRTYTTNGTKTITGEFNGGTVNINVHPSNRLVETITSNGMTSFSGEWKDAAITVAVQTTVTVTMTQAQYDALQVEDPNTIYLING